MSIEAVVSAFERRDLSSRDMLILTALAAYERGGIVALGVNSLADMTRLSERTVQRALRSMEEARVLTVVRPATRYWPTVYLLPGVSR